MSTKKRGDTSDLGKDANKTSESNCKFIIEHLMDSRSDTAQGKMSKLEVTQNDLDFR